VQSARLRLSDGRQITSSVAIVPAQLGGPTGFYYQVVRGPSPIPVSLAELDVNGRVLRMVKLNRFVGTFTSHWRSKSPRAEAEAKVRPDTSRTYSPGRSGGPANHTHTPSSTVC
jgi:hypothetical protein